MRLIDADALIKTLNEEKIKFNADVNYFILNAPTIDAEPVKHGKWIKVGDNTYRCSRCNEVSCCNGNFCTDCGARMEMEE